MCAHCRRETAVFAIALPRDHEVLDVESVADAWTPAPAGALVFHVERLSTPVQSRLRILAPLYRRDYSCTTGGAHWINHCQKCGSLQEDHDLHCEPESAFMPTTAEAAAAIQVIEVRDAFAAAVAGYSYDVHIFGSRSHP
jgi:hypothetical protein